MTDHQLTEFAVMIGQPVAVARQILEQEARDKTAHNGRNVANGYDYDLQVWCGCNYCQGAR